MRSRVSPFAVAIGFVTFGAAAGPLSAAEVVGKPWAVSDLIGKKGDPAEDLSGIACAPEADGARVCLVIDDEVEFAQWVTLKNGTIIPGELLPLISGFSDEKPVELDGEGAAFAAGAFYVTGSFGQPRKGASDEEKAARLKANTHLFRIVAEGDSLQFTDSRRLRAIALENADLKPFADKELEKNGLTVEAIAVVAAGDALRRRGTAGRLSCPQARPRRRDRRARPRSGRR